MVRGHPGLQSAITVQDIHCSTKGVRFFSGFWHSKVQSRHHAYQIVCIHTSQYFNSNARHSEDYYVGIYARQRANHPGRQHVDREDFNPLVNQLTRMLQSIGNDRSYKSFVHHFMLMCSQSMISHYKLRISYGESPPFTSTNQSKEAEGVTILYKILTVDL